MKKAEFASIKSRTGSELPYHNTNTTQGLASLQSAPLSLPCLLTLLGIDCDPKKKKRHRYSNPLDTLHPTWLRVLRWPVCLRAGRTDSAFVRRVLRVLSFSPERLTARQAAQPALPSLSHRAGLGSSGSAVLSHHSDRSASCVGPSCFYPSRTARTRLPAHATQPIRGSIAIDCLSGCSPPHPLRAAIDNVLTPLS